MAASSKGMPAGIGSKAFSRAQTYSANAPNVPAAKRSVMTSSPSLKRVTAGPTASTTPAASMPTALSFGARKPRKRRMNPGFGFRPSRSARLTDAARTRIST